MKPFSQREGFKPARVELQLNSMDDGLRSRLWNVLCDTWYVSPETNRLQNYRNQSLKSLMESFWHDYFQRPLDTIPDWWPDCYNVLRDYFFGCAWYEVYDMLEFRAGLMDDEWRARFARDCNKVLEEDLSGYRFVGKEISQITSAEEISSIEEALASPAALAPVARHLSQALALLSDRAKPDYRNSIKESISAVESLSKIVSGSAKTTLGDALKLTEGKAGLHPAQRKAFESLYGYTSDAQGIRHALLEEPSLGFDDAKYMLVSCSAFINYLVGKLTKAGIKF